MTSSCPSSGRIERGGDVQISTLLRVAQSLGLQMLLLPFDVAILARQWMRERGTGLSLEAFESGPPFFLEEADED